MADLENRIKEVVSQFQNQANQFDKLKYENIDLKLKFEESKGLISHNV